MSIIINNFEIINGGQSIAIDVETNIGFTITSILLWESDNFKDYATAKNLTPYLEQISNVEILIIDAIDLGISRFTDILFIEIESDFIDVDECANCLSPALGITYNLSEYYNCLMNAILEMVANECLSCENKPSNKLVMMINMLIDSIERAVEVGYYSQAIQMIKKLKKLCSINQCNNCPTITCSDCSKFKQN